jgi:vancomycin permeability regulator SanA
MRRERRFSWRLTLTVILGLLFCILSLLPNFIDELVMTTPYYSFLHDLNTPWPFIQSVFELLFAELSAYLECLLIATVLLCVKAGRHVPKDNQDFLIILGCHVMPDGSPTKELKKRLDRAIEFYNSQKKTNGNPPTIIVSGGKGNNEPISEAESMKKYLLKHKIPASKIIKEEKSTTTFENLKFSKKIIPKDSKVSIVTTNYHVFRAGILATSFKLKVSSLGAKVSSPLWLNSIVREYIAVLFAEKRRHIFAFVAIVILVSLVEAVVYWHYAN